jgi:hypothetical protein
VCCAGHWSKRGRRGHHAAASYDVLDAIGPAACGSLRVFHDIAARTAALSSDFFEAHGGVWSRLAHESQASICGVDRLSTGLARAVSLSSQPRRKRNDLMSARRSWQRLISSLSLAACGALLMGRGEEPFATLASWGGNTTHRRRRRRRLHVDPHFARQYRRQS